jgi:hypothetical protein
MFVEIMGYYLSETRGLSFRTRANNGLNAEDEMMARLSSPCRRRQAERVTIGLDAWALHREW